MLERAAVNPMEDNPMVIMVDNPGQDPWLIVAAIEASWALYTSDALDRRLDAAQPAQLNPSGGQRRRATGGTTVALMD